MFEKKIRFYLSDEERSLMTRALMDLKNRLHEEGRYTDSVDEILLKVLSAKKKKIKII